MSPPNATFLPTPPTLNPYVFQNKPPTLNPYVLQNKPPSLIRTNKPVSKPASTEAQVPTRRSDSDWLDLSALPGDLNADKAGTEKDIEERLKEKNSEEPKEESFSLLNNIFGLFKVPPATDRNKVVAFERQSSPVSNNSFKSFAAVA